MIMGQRIRLRAAERQDIPLFVRWLNDPEVRKNISIYLPLSLADEEQWFENMQQNHPAEHPLVIEVSQADGDSWVPIGNCSLMNIDWRNRKAEFGIFIGEKAYWNQGYGTETTRLILKHGFDTLNLQRIFLQVFATNPRAIRAYEKAGFIHEGRLRQGMFLDGAYVDVLVMSVLRTEWKPDEG